MNRPLLSLLLTLLVPLLAPDTLVGQTASPLDEARAAMQARDFAKAAALLEPLTGVGAKDAVAFHLLSEVRLAQRKATEAVVLAERATVLDATKPAHFAQLGAALGQRMSEVNFMQQAMMAGKLKAAFAKAVELDPNNIPGLIGLGRFYSQAPEIAGGSLEKARELARRVQQLDPFAGGIELGHLAAREEKFAEALLHFESAAAAQPGNLNAPFNCGRMLAKLGRKDEARARFEGVLKINPAFEAAKKALADLGVAMP